MVCGLFSHIKNIHVKNIAYKNISKKNMMVALKPDLLFFARQQDRDNLWLSVATSTMRGVVIIIFLNVHGE